MGSENKNKKWAGLKLPAGGILFSPRADKKPAVKKRGRKPEEQSPVSGASSGATALTDSFTENEEASPRNNTSPGRMKKFGGRTPRRPKSGDNHALRNPSSQQTTPGHSRRRTSGALDLLRNAMFSRIKEPSSTTFGGPSDAREISESFRIDPYFDSEDFSNSRQSTVQPPSTSESTSSEASVQSTTKPTQQSRPPRAMGKGARPALSALKPPRPDLQPYDPTLSQKLRIGESRFNTSSQSDAPRSPRPMKTGLRNTLVNSMAMPSTIEEDSEGSSFQPTLSQKLRIGEEQIKKKIETRQTPRLDPRFTPPPSIDTGDCLSTLSSVSEAAVPGNATNISSNLGNESTATAKVSNLLGDDGQPVSPRVTPQSAPGRKVVKSRDPKKSSPTNDIRPKALASPKTHRRHREKSPAAPHNENSDSTKKSPRGRSKPRRSKTPTESHSKPRTTSTNKTARKESIQSREDSIHRRNPNRSRKSPSHSRHSRHSNSGSRHNRENVRHQVEKRRAMSNGPLDGIQHSNSSQVRASPGSVVDRKKRSKSLDESLSRSKGGEEHQSKTREVPRKGQTHRHNKHGDVSKEMNRPATYDSSRHAKEQGQTRVLKSQKHTITVEKKRSKSAEESPRDSRHDTKNVSTGSQHYHRRSSHDETSARERARSLEPSPHCKRTQPEGHSSWAAEKPLPVKNKASSSSDESPAHEKSSACVESNSSNSQSPDRESEHGRRPPGRNTSSSTDEEKPRSPRLAERKAHKKYTRDSSKHDGCCGLNDLKMSRNRMEKVPKSPQKVLSKAEIAKRDELSNSGRSSGTSSRHSRSPGRILSSHDHENSISSRSPSTSRRQARREKLQSDILKNELSDSSRRISLRHSRSYSPNRRSTSSSHPPRSPKSPSRKSIRSASPRGKTSPREKWEALLERKDSKTANVIKPPLVSGSSAEDHNLPKRHVRDEDCYTQEGQDKIHVPPSPKTVRRTNAMIPPLTPESNRLKIDSYTHSPLSKKSEEGKALKYRAVNKMADRTFQSPLVSPPGRHSHSAPPPRIPPSPLPLSEPPTVAAPVEEQDATEDEARRSRTTTLKSNLRKMEQQYSQNNASGRSHRSASAKSRTSHTGSSHSRGPSSRTSTHTRRSPSRHQTRQENTTETCTRSPSRSGSRDRMVKPSVKHIVPSISPSSSVSQPLAPDASCLDT